MTGAREPRPGRLRRKRAALRAALGLSVALACLPAPPAAGRQAQGAGPSDGPSERPPDGAAGAVTVTVSGRGGRPVEAVAAGDLRLELAGAEVPVASLAPLDEPWRVVVLFNARLSPTRSVRNGAIELAGQADRLTALGAVEVRVLGRELRAALPATADRLTVEQGLGFLALREEGEDAQRRLRQAFLDDLGELARGGGEPPDGRRGDEIGGSLRQLARVAQAARGALAEEARLLAGARRRLIAWAAEERPAGPGLLLLVGAGFDAEPAPFYRSALAAAGYGDLAEGLEAPPLEPTMSQVGAVLAAYGWRVVPFIPAVDADIFLTDDALLPGGLPAEESPDAPELEREPGVDEAVAGVDLLKIGRRRGEAEEGEPEPLVPLQTAPTAALAALAEETGGEVVRAGRGLAALLDGLEGGLRLTWSAIAVAGAPPPGELVPLSVAVRAGDGRRGWRLAAPSWAPGPTPIVASEVRVLELLAGDVAEAEGELPVVAALASGLGEPEGLGSAELLIELPEETELSGPLRATVAIAWGGAEPSVFHRRLATRSDPEGVAWSRDAEDERRYYSLTVPLPGGSGSRVAVLVEELDSGRWGGAFASLVAATAEAGGDGGGLLLPAPRIINLMAPREILAVGPTGFSAVVSDRRVARVVYLLDGEPVAEASARPFPVQIDLGRLPRAREVEAVAYGADGAELGRDRLVVNEGAGSLRVRIVEPDRERLRAGGIFGPVDVEAEVKVPRFTDLERVEFYWNTTLVATAFGPPFRQRIVVPEESPQGFVRVVARLADGSAGEDVIFLNSPGSLERLDVSLVELYLVVTDRDGRPVRGLERDDFRVVEEGAEQEIATFSAAGNLPLTVGLALDTSASMFVKLPKVQRAAAEFVLGSLDERDRAFLVSFGDEPALAQDTTASAEEMMDAIGRLRPEGQTAVWKSIVYSLVQLQGVPGRKALVVYSDGADEDEEFPYRTCLTFARRLGVPIYVILTNNEIYRTGGRNLAVRSYLDRLERLAAAVGGKVYLTRVGEDLGEIYREIAQELRSQYLVAYYPRERSDEEFREVDVEVLRRGMEVRTISGYFR